MRILSIAVCLMLPAAPVLSAQAAAATTDTSLHWGPAPAAFPKGATMAVLKGDPSKAEPFTVELSLPRGYVIPPHFHPTDETVTVQQGVLLVGMGDVFDPAKTKTLKVGGSHTIPAQAHHFAATSGATVIMVSAMGPFAMTYVNPADDPQTHAGKP
jgi:quercetin dioxygenase-like cupin family protein